MNRNLPLFRLLGAAAAVTLAACARPPADDAPPTPPDQLSYAPALDVDLGRFTKLPTGVYVLDVVPGTGDTARTGRVVSVKYTGWLPDGTKFDSNADRPNDTFNFVLDAGMVIPGWDKGVAGMQVGGTRRLVIPPQMGYGRKGAGGVIPPNATLVFDVELLAVN